MSMRNRVRIVFALTALVLVTLSTPAQSQKIRVGGSNKSGKSDNDNGGRRNRNRNNDQNNNNQSDGSDAQQIQQALQGIQGTTNDGSQQGELNPLNGQFQGGKKFKKSQQWQNWQQNGQGNFKKKHKHNDWQGWAIQFGGPAPFSAQWYNHHPQAWHHNHHHNDDAWKIATAAGVLGWLGWHADPYHHDHHHAIYEPVPYETFYVEGQPTFDPNTGDWMPLGVYSLAVGPDGSGTRMLDLSVDKHGRIRGNYYDAILNASHTVTGRIDQQSQYVQWSLDSNKQLTFFAPLSQLTQPQGIVTVRFPGGQQEQWQLTRMENSGN